MKRRMRIATFNPHCSLLTFLNVDIYPIRPYE
jgi:hypothetical protein